MIDTFDDRRTGLESPAANAFEVTPHDTNELASVTRAIYVGTTGNVRLVTINNETVTFVDVPAGNIIPIRAFRILSTGTTADDIVGMY